MATKVKKKYKAKGFKMLLDIKDSSQIFLRYTPCDKCKYESKREDCKEVRIETDAIEMWKNECEDGAWLIGCTAGCELKERQ